jgi:glucosyl-dolichyl phosphate glucuronosyltransferase
MFAKISVILCTYNRSAYLSNALASLAASTLPESTDWEVLVVDNNSSDQTREVIERFCVRYPNRFRYLRETRQGKSHALNLGIKEASGGVLAFTDDDVVVDSDWLHNLTQAIDGKLVAGAGGKILPERKFESPKWLPTRGKYPLAPLAFFDPAQPAGPLTDTPFGANMAFHRRMFEEHGGFRTDLGPKPGAGSPEKSEDSEFGHRLLNAGECLRYEPSAVVYHVVPESRLTKEYFLAWWFDKARADVRAFGRPQSARWRVAGVPLHLFRRLTACTLRWMSAIEPSRRFSCKVNVWALGGEIWECYRQSHLV